MEDADSANSLPSLHVVVKLEKVHLKLEMASFQKIQLSNICSLHHHRASSLQVFAEISLLQLPGSSQSQPLANWLCNIHFSPAIECYWALLTPSMPV